MKALVLSGGSGTRLRPFSYHMPKQLIPIGGKPVLEHVLEGIRELAITEIGIVVGERAPEIIEAIGDGSRFGARITYIRQDRPLGLAHCVAAARPFLGDDDFVMFLGDNFLPDGIAATAAQFRQHRPAAQILVHRVADPTAFGVAEIDPGGAVRRLVEKPAQPRSDLAVIGVYLFTAAVHQAVDMIEPSARGELEITDAIQWLVDSGARVQATEYDGYWRDIGRIEDVLECNRRQLTGLRTGTNHLVDAGSEIRGEVALGAGVRVIRSRIHGPVVVGAGSVIEDSTIGPNTSIGSGCTVHATRMAESIVLDGTSVSDLAGLYGSVIGGAATADRHPPASGDHARIEVAA